MGIHGDGGDRGKGKGVSLLRLVTGPGAPGTPTGAAGYFRGPHAGPAQQRYGDYFGRVLYSPQLRDPEQPTVMLSQIVFKGFELLNTSAGDSMGDSSGQWLEDDSAPFLVVFQYGRSVWAGFPETRVRLNQPGLRFLLL